MVVLRRRLCGPWCFGLTFCLHLQRFIVLLGRRGRFQSVQRNLPVRESSIERHSQKKEIPFHVADTRQPRVSETAIGVAGVCLCTKNGKAVQW